MSTKSNVYSQGGGGITYEFEVDTAFMLQLLMGGTVPGLDDSKIEKIRFQSGSLGYETDDLLLHCLGPTGETHRALFQIKHILTISEKNTLFQEVMHKAWQDFTNSVLFNPALDKIYLVKSDLTADEKKHLKTLCNWAKVKPTASDFIREANLIAAKKTYLNLFQKALTAAKGTELTNDELFAFFRCFDILELDFGEVASTAKSNFLSIISQVKTESCTLLPMQIWNEVFAFVSHADNKGGAYEASNLPTLCRSYFKPAYYATLQRKLTLLSVQSAEILDDIEDRISGFRLERIHYQEEVINELAVGNIAIITGEPGTGKSAIGKQFLRTIQNSHAGFLLVFRADELGSIQLRDYFHQRGIEHSITDIFRFFPLQTTHYIYIDALEKLCESEGTAFRQLLKAIAPFPNIQLIASCRQAELPLIRLGYLSDYSFTPVRVSVLTPDELVTISEALPILIPVLQNERLSALLHFPKYLDFAYRAARLATTGFSDIDEQQFIRQLWEVIVENKVHGNLQGLPAKRSSLFLQIAVTRARQMTPYVSLPIADQQALSALEKDGVITQSKYKDTAFAPAHDILEDWALIHHVNNNHETDSLPIDFFKRLGEEPAMRRAYRLWSRQVLQYGTPGQRDFLVAVLTDTTLPAFWSDEAIIALLNSSYLSTFLQANSLLLLKDDWSLLIELIHLLRTACREVGELLDTGKRAFLPIGEGWQKLFQFLSGHISLFPPKHYDLLLYTINDWHLILHSREIATTETNAPGQIIQWLLDNHYIKTAPYADDKKVTLCLKLFFECGGSLVPEIIDLLETILAIRSGDRQTTPRNILHFSDEVADLALAGMTSTQLAKYTPEILIRLMKEAWYYHPPVRQQWENDNEWFFRNRSSNPDKNMAFGLVREYTIDYSPASAFQTPVCWLLKYHPRLVLPFIIDLLNHATESYCQSEYIASDKPEKIMLYLSGGQRLEQYGSTALWCIYRGTIFATPDLLQSVLMALEKFLLEIAAGGLDQKDFFQEVIEQIYTSSKTVALTAVIASVAQAYPAMMDKWIVPLFSGRKMIGWDVQRYNADFNPSNWKFPNTDEVFWLEREASNKLSHRHLHSYGLKGLVVNYCFDVREYNQEIFALLDKLKKEAKPTDWEWKKMLADMDARQWRVTKTERVDNLIRQQIRPVYTGKLAKEVRKMEVQAELYINSVRTTNWLITVSDKKEQPELSKWREIVAGYKALQSVDWTRHHPGTAAAIGIEHFWDELLQEEKQWCYDTVMDITSRLLKKEVQLDFLNSNVSTIDDGTVPAALVLLLTKQGIDAEQHLLVLADVLFANTSHNTPWYIHFLEAFGTSMWESRPAQMLRLWKAAVHFAKLEKKNPATYRSQYTQAEIQVYEAEVEALRHQLITDTFPFSLPTIELPEDSLWVLQKAVKILPPENCPPDGIVFLLQLVDQYILALSTPPPEKPLNNREREERFNAFLKVELEGKIAQVILWDAHSKGTILLRELMNRYDNTAILEVESEPPGRRRDSFLRKVLKGVIHFADHALPENDPVKKEHTIRCFQTVWTEYLKFTFETGKIFCGDLLLLGIDWKENSKDWDPLKGFETFFIHVIGWLGLAFIPPIVNLLSHVGDERLIPSGFPVLWQKITESPTPLQLLSMPYMTQLISRIYDHHLEFMAQNAAFLQCYLHMLDEMVKEGASEAYWYREKMVSFRRSE